MVHALRHIWVTYDGDEADDRAYGLALELARPLGARLTLVHATRTVLANGLDLLGVSAPERM